MLFPQLRRAIAGWFSILPRLCDRSYRRGPAGESEDGHGCVLGSRGSTALGERLDPEALREVLDRYFDEMRSALERHVGTVEKYIGDAVMAVFGLPRAHEDDALRAVRAAWDMRAALAVLDNELQLWGATLHNRTGVSTGRSPRATPQRRSG